MSHIQVFCGGRSGLNVIHQDKKPLEGSQQEQHGLCGELRTGGDVVSVSEKSLENGSC